MRRDARKTKNNIMAGVYPVTGQAFTKIGSFMASQLEKAFGRDKLLDYHKTGPIAFFRDYLALSQASPSLKKSYPLKKRFSQLLFRWDRDWANSNTDNIGLSPIPLDVEFGMLQKNLKTAFSRASLYPDFHEDLIRVAQFHLKSNRTHQASSFLNLAHELYPNRIGPMTALASLHIWTGNAQEARRFFRMVHAKDPSHPGVSIGKFQSLARDLLNANKHDNLTDLAEIVTEVYADSPGIAKGLGDMFYNLGQKDIALQYYKKALKLDRKLEDVRDKIRTLEKEKKK
jgi:tetratricopeptide (TPR) repeat protein